MSETLLIHYDIENAQQATWALCNDAGELSGKLNSGSLHDLAAFSKEHRAIVLLSSQCLHINQLNLPTQNLQKQLKAIPFAIEEYIADDIEDFHFVIAKNKHDNTTTVVGIKQTVLQNIIDIFKKHAIKVEKIIPDALCLAADEKQWACLNYLEHNLLQTDTTNGMVVSSDILPYVINNKLRDESQAKPEKIILLNEQENSTVFDEINLGEIKTDKAGDKDIEVIRVVYNSHPLVVFCGNYKQALPLNLLQHKFKQKRHSSGYWQHWRLAASLAAIWLVLHLSLTAFQYSQLAEENLATKAKIESIYKKAFPKSRKIINPRSQMEQKLKELKGTSGGSDSGLIFLLAEAFGTLSHDKDKITLQTLTFRNNRMDIGLDSSNLQAVETLNKNLNNNKNIQSEITSSSSEKDKVKGNLRIEGKS